MAGLGSESVIPLRPELATNLQPLNFAVQENAVARVSQAFRDGQVSANDIIERYSALAKTRDKAQIQGLEEFISPQAIQARQQHAALMSDKDKSEISLLPVAEQAKRAELEAVKIKAAQGDTASMREYAIKNGFGPNLSQPTGGNYTAENSTNDSRVYADAVRYAQAIKSAEGIVKDIKPLPNTKRFTDAAGGYSEDTDFNNPILSSESGKHTYTQDQSVKATNLARMSPQQWIAAGRPSADEYVLGIKPPEPQSNQPAVSGKVTDLATPRKTVEVEERKADGSTKTTRTVIEPTQHPNAPQSIADLAPGQVYKAPPIGSQKATAEQDKAKLGVPRFADAAKLMDELKAGGYNPSGTWASAKSFLPGPLKEEERQSFELAQAAFRQAIGRLESGAAISISENKNYDAVFFPKWGDTAKIMQEKESLRDGVAAVAAEIATAGGVISPEAQARADALKERAKKISPASASTQSGGTVTEVSPGKKLFLGTDGHYHYAK